MHDGENAAVQHLLDARDGRRLVAQRDRGIERVPVGFGQRLTKIGERGLEPPDLYRERLERDRCGGRRVSVLLRTEPERQRHDREGGGQGSREDEPDEHATLY